MERMDENTMVGRIRRAREQAGLTQEEVAGALDVSRQAVGKWETGQSRPSTENLLRLAQVLRTDLQALTLGEDGREAEIAENQTQENEETAAVTVQPQETEQGRGTVWKDRFFSRLSAGIVIGCLLGAAVTLAVSVWGDYMRYTKEDPATAEEASLSMGSLQETEEDFTADIPENAAGELGTDGTMADVIEEAEETQYAESEPQAFLETLTVQGEECRRFGSYANYGDPADAETVEKNRLFAYHFPDSAYTVTFYRERSDYTDDLGRPLWHLLAAYDSGVDASGGRQYTVIARIAEDEPDAGSPSLAAFEALGYAGCKLTCRSWRFDHKDTYYFVVDENRQVPVLWALFQGTPCEADLDSDGENEILSFNSPFEPPAVFDRGVEEYTAYTIQYPDGYTLSCGPAAGDNTGEAAVTLTAWDGSERRYRHLWNGQLTCGQTACSVQGMEELAPEVAAAVVTFVPEGEYVDTGDPDLPFMGNAEVFTQRQFAYMGLQCLYGLTGFAPRRCYAKASEYGVWFGLEPDCENSFLGFSRGPAQGAGENVVGGIDLSWKQEWVEWSPLDPAAMDVDTGDKLALARWTYERLPFLQQGGIVSDGWGLGDDVRLFLEDGRFFEVSFDGESGLPNRLQGPYPEGFEH